MQYFKMGDVVGVRNDALIALLNNRQTTEHDILNNLKANPASEVIVQLLKNRGEKIGEGKELCFGLLTDIYSLDGGLEGEVGYLSAFEDEGGGDEVYRLEVWLIGGNADDELSWPDSITGVTYSCNTCGGSVEAPSFETLFDDNGCDCLSRALFPMEP